MSTSIILTVTAIERKLLAPGTILVALGLVVSPWQAGSALRFLCKSWYSGNTNINRFTAQISWITDRYWWLHSKRITLLISALTTNNKCLSSRLWYIYIQSIVWLPLVSAASWNYMYVIQVLGIHCVYHADSAVQSWLLPGNMLTLYTFLVHIAYWDLSSFITRNTHRPHTSWFNVRS